VIRAKTVERELEVYKLLLEEMVEIRTQQLQEEINERMRIEERLIEEKERAQVTLKSIGDAVITTDIRGLVEFINPVAEKLTGWRSEEARGKSIEKIFKIVYEESRKTAVNPVYRCINQEKAVGLDDHLLLINRQGSNIAFRIPPRRFMIVKVKFKG
jgi:PAS domain S-box-containing protein